MATLEDATRQLAGRYVLDRVLGRGGMATVFAARDRRLDRQVAVKVVPVAVTDSVGRDRFVREARSAAGLCHPNAVSVFDAGESDGFLFIVMELVEGQSLSELLADGGPLEVDEALTVATSLLAALGEAHAAGIVHRDVKPSNVMVTFSGAVKLLDFGIARRLDELVGSVTAVGDILGTPKYLAPEQIDGRPTSPATDLYAVGVVLFEMLAGFPPFDGESLVATAFAHTTAPIPDVREVRADVPESLSSAIRAAMAKDPADRFSDAAEMRRALRDAHTSATDRSATRVLPESFVATDPTRLLPADGYGRRRRVPWSLLGVAALGLVGLVSWNFAEDIFSFITSDERSDTPLAQASPTTTLAPTTTATLPTTIEGVIAALRANPEAYGRHTDEIVDELVKIEQGDAPNERAADLLDALRAWVDNGEATPATLALLEPILSPLIETPVDDGNGNGGGNGNGHGHGNGKKDK